MKKNQQSTKRWTAHQAGGGACASLEFLYYNYIEVQTVVILIIEKIETRTWHIFFFYRFTYKFGLPMSMTYDNDINESTRRVYICQLKNHKHETETSSSLNIYNLTYHADRIWNSNTNTNTRRRTYIYLFLKSYLFLYTFSYVNILHWILDNASPKINKIRSHLELWTN